MAEKKCRYQNIENEFLKRAREADTKIMQEKCSYRERATYLNEKEGAYYLKPL